MTTAKPTTAAEANKLLKDLETKRTALTDTINSTADRRKGHVVAAEFGDEAAKETLRKISAEATEATDALQNLEVVVSQITLLRNELAADEATARELETAAAVDAAVDALLALDDKIDAGLDSVRNLLAQRRELAADPVLRKAKTKSAGSLVVRDREIGRSILSYFDRELFFVGWDASYATITRVADWDGRYFGNQSPGQIARGPRELSPFERTLKQALYTPAPMQGNGGFDSQVESDKFHAAGGRKPVRDISGGWSADA